MEKSKRDPLALNRFMSTFGFSGIMRVEIKLPRNFTLIQPGLFTHISVMTPSELSQWSKIRRKTVQTQT